MDPFSIPDEIFDLIESPMDRAMMVLHYHWGLTEKEIAHAFGIHENMVQAILDSARRNLKLLADDDFNERRQNH